MIEFFTLIILVIIKNMIKPTSIFIGIAILFTAPVVSAADLNLSKTYSSCMSQSGGVTYEMLNCIGIETKHQDALLNQAYKRVMADLSPERKKQLKEVQRTWIKYRDLNCNFYADPNGGTNASILSSDCFMQTTASRARELEGFIY